MSSPAWIRRNRPPEGEAWMWLTATMLGSITYGALGVSALRILTFLLHEHASHGGAENGNLAAPYLQLERWGVTAADVRKGLAELEITGFVDRTHQGLRVSGGGDPSRYALTWLPTHGPKRRLENPPTHRWRAVIRKLVHEGFGDVRLARRWLRDQIAAEKRGRRRK